MFVRNPMTVALGGRNEDSTVLSGQPARSGRTARLTPTVWAAFAAASLVMTASAAFAVPVAGYTYGIDNTGAFWMMDMAGQNARSLFQTSLNTPTNALAFNGARNDFFSVDANNDLYWIDPLKNAGVKIATAAEIGITNAAGERPWSAAYYDNAYWFFLNSVGNGSDQLRRVNISYSGTGPSVTTYDTYTAAGVTLPNQFGDIAITPAGKLYAYTSVNSGGNFYSLDLTAIASGTVGGYELISTTTGTSMQIAFNPNYTVLYGHDSFDGAWYTVGLGDGSLSRISGLTTFINGAGFPDIAGSSVQPVPEPSSLALAAMAGGFVAWRVSRRRRAAKGRGRVSAAREGFPAGATLASGILAS